MKKASLRKSIAAAILLLVLGFSATAINTPLVKADVGGIGKKLTLKIVGEGFVTTTKVKSAVTLFFHPAEGYHVSAIKIDGDFISKEDSDFTSYTFPKVTSGHTIVVFFSAIGTATVPFDTDVLVYLGDGVSIYFPSTEGEGIATQQNLLAIHQFLVGTSLILWEVTVEVSFDGDIEIAFPLPPGTEIPEKVFQHSDLYALCCDVNGDGDVDGDDVSDVANAVKSYTGHGLYDANCDVDLSEEIDENDVHLVNEYKGTLLQSLNFRVEDRTLYVEVDHNGVMRAR